MNNRIIPQPVAEAAKAFCARYGENIVYIGKYKKQDVYMYEFPDDVEIGFPFIYLYNPDIQKVLEITGSDSLDILERTE